MPDDILIVPTVLPSGSLHFASVQQHGTVADVINTLSDLDEVKTDILGNLHPRGWAIQLIRKETPGRQWEETELESLGDGLVDESASVAPLIQTTSSDPSLERHFSAFALTSHLHSPVLRLVSLHPSLSATILFLRVPEIHDGFTWKCFFSRAATVADVSQSILDALGLARSLPGPGGGTVLYVIEDVWAEGDVEKASTLTSDACFSDLLLSPVTPPGFSAKAKHFFRFSVPDEWYRRSRPRSTSSMSVEPSESTIKAVQEMEASEEEDAGGTAKQNPAHPASKVPSPAKPSTEWRQSLSQARFSSVFDSWLRPSTSTSPPKVTKDSALPERMSVSEPKLMGRTNGDSHSQTSQDDNWEDGLDTNEFEQMLDDLGLKEPQRRAMHLLSGDRKLYLLDQHRQSRIATSKLHSPHGAQPSYPATYGPSSAGNLLPRIVPQLTGDSGLIKRLSIGGWGATTALPPSASGSNRKGDRTESNWTTVQQEAKATEEPQPLQPQTTGGLWSSWWASSGGEKAAGRGQLKEGKSPKWYVNGIKGKVLDTRLVKHLISLRVHLSTARVFWVGEFVGAEGGLGVLSAILASLVGRAGKRKDLSDIEGAVLLEIMKILRVLSNTEPGFNAVLDSPTTITHIAYSLHHASSKLRALVSDLLAAICVLAIPEGHKMVMAAMSDYRVVFDEAFRFEELIASLRLPEFDADDCIGSVDQPSEDDGAWEARTASMVLINALTNGPESLEERILLREEFSRRGLNEVIVTLRYIRPPEGLVTQLDVYTEEKFEDEEDMRERASHLVQGDSRLNAPELTSALEELVNLTISRTEDYDKVIRILRALISMFQQQGESILRIDLSSIIATFVEQTCSIGDLQGDWPTFLKSFVASVQDVTGNPGELWDAEDDTRVALRNEIETLQGQVEHLTAETLQLREVLSQQKAELTTLKAITTSAPISASRGLGKGGPESFHGLVQRLVLKEKQVTQLQSELDNLKSSSPIETREIDERARREREKTKWTSVMDEIANHKTHIADLESTNAQKEKELLYLKRALESVYSRFRSREESKEADTDVDAALLAERAIENMSQKEKMIATLKTEIDDLKVQLAAKPKFITEKDFKVRVAPPPPPSPRAANTKPKDNDQLQGASLPPSPPRGPQLPLEPLIRTLSQPPSSPPPPPP
ncbi:armadillo-type protein, partial [Lactarius deliciosus]